MSANQGWSYANMFSNVDATPPGSEGNVEIWPSPEESSEIVVQTSTTPPRPPPPQFRIIQDGQHQAANHEGVTLNPVYNDQTTGAVPTTPQYGHNVKYVYVHQEQSKESGQFQTTSQVTSSSGVFHIQTCPQSPTVHTCSTPNIYLQSNPNVNYGSIVSTPAKPSTPSRGKKLQVSAIQQSHLNSGQGVLLQTASVVNSNDLVSTAEAGNSMLDRLMQSPEQTLQLKKNVIYEVKSSSGSKVAMWDGTRFVDVDDPADEATLLKYIVKNNSKISGGGSGGAKRQNRGYRGNATGMHMNQAGTAMEVRTPANTSYHSNQTSTALNSGEMTLLSLLPKAQIALQQSPNKSWVLSPKTPTMTKPSSSSVFTNGRKFHYVDTDTLIRRPLHTDATQVQVAQGMHIYEIKVQRNSGSRKIPIEFITSTSQPTPSASSLGVKSRANHLQNSQAHMSDNSQTSTTQNSKDGTTGNFEPHSTDNSQADTTGNSQPHSTENSQASSTATTKDNTEEPGEDLGEGIFKVCPHCGGLSKVVRRCESCGKTLPENAKTFKKDMGPEIVCRDVAKTRRTVEQPVVSKHSFYGQKLQEQQQAYKAFSVRKCVPKKSTHFDLHNVIPKTSHAKRKTERAKTVRPKKRKPEPVTVTISSDEEESETTPNKCVNITMNSSLDASLNSGLNTSINSGLNVSMNSNTQSPANTSQNSQSDNMDNTSMNMHINQTFLAESRELFAGDSEVSSSQYCVPETPENTAYHSVMPSSDDGMASSDSPIFPGPDSTLPSPKVSRRHKMEDAAGNIVKNPRRRPPKTVSELVEEQQDGEGKYLLLPPDPKVTWDVRCVRVGSLKGKPNEPVFISKEGFFIKMECEDNSHDIQLQPSDIERVGLCLQNRMSVIFLYTSGACGLRLREELNMVIGEEPYFEPCGLAIFQSYHDEATWHHPVKLSSCCFKEATGTRHPRTAHLAPTKLCMVQGKLYCGFHKSIPKPQSYSCAVQSDMRHKLITLILESAGDEEKRQDLAAIFSYYQRLKPHRPNFSEDLTYADANMILVNSSSQEIRDRLSITGNMSGRSSQLDTSEGMGTTNTEAADHSVSGQPAFLPATFNGPIEKILTYPPPPEKGGITVTTEDLFCLTDGEFLNDVIIDFYLKYLLLDKLSAADRQKAHVFSSFFYKRLTQKQPRGAASLDDGQPTDPKERRHERVKTWTRHVDLFSKDYIIVPINEHSHWFLAIICFCGYSGPTVLCQTVPKSGQSYLPTVGYYTDQNSGAAQGDHSQPMDTQEPAHTKGAKEAKVTHFIQPCILVFDSLAGPTRTTVVRTLREYLQIEWRIKKKTDRKLDKETIKGGYPKVPQQNNYSDCGIYVLQYVESFFETPMTDFNIPVRGLQDWFSEVQISKKRGELRELILSLQERTNQAKAQSLNS